MKFCKFADSSDSSSDIIVMKILNGPFIINCANLKLGRTNRLKALCMMKNNT